MGKRIIQRRRGKGSLTYTSNSHRYKGEIKHRIYDERERNDVVKGKIVDLIHCPGHSAPLAKVKYETGEEVLIAAPLGSQVNQEVQSGIKSEIKDGNTLPLKSIPDGTNVYNIELKPGDGGKLVKASGGFAKVLGRVKDKILVRLPSKKQKEFSLDCRATIGVVGGGGRGDKPFIKAGRRWHAMKARGRLYPQTSGVAMNAIDHPFGSGRGRHVGKPTVAPRNAPPGRKVGQIRASKTGRGK